MTTNSARHAREVFPNHPPRPVDASVFDQIEQVAVAVVNLRDTLNALAAPYRFLALSVTADELAEVYAMTYEAEQQFRSHGLRDFSGDVRVTPVASKST
jgi:hypothetical protein